MTGIHRRRLWLETHAVPLRNERNEIIALLGITRDITERKNAELMLQDESSLNRSMEILSR
jgi:PAS domain S-box-containing protein